MALKDIHKDMHELLSQIMVDLKKAEGGNKAASQRVRTGTVKLEKSAKFYRKESIKAEKATKGQKKSGKKAPSKAHAAHGHAAKPAKAKAKTQKAVARPRALSIRKPTAKLPHKKAASHR
jgi:Histone H1-like protein Hc1